MPQKDFDRVLETSASQGAGDVQLAGAVMGYQSLADAGAVDGDPVDLYLEDVFPSTGVPTGAWECGTYTWRTGGILQRTTIRGSSNAGQPVTWGPGLRRVGAGLLSYMIQAIRSVSGLQAEVVAVAGVASSVPTVAAHAADVTTVAGSIGSVTTVAGAIANVNAVAPRVADVQALVPSVGAIAAVAPHIADVTAVAGNMANVTAVAGNAININAVAADKANIDLVAGDKASIDLVAGDLVRIDAVAGNKANIDMVAATKTNIDAVVAAKANVDTVAGAIANVNAVAVDRANIDAVAGALGTVNTVAADLVNLNNVAGELAHINQVAAVLPNVATVATNVAAIASVAADMAAVKAVANDLANVDAVLTNKPNIDTVAGNMNSVATVAGIQPAVQSVAANMPAVQAVGPSIPAIQAVYAALPTIVGSPATASAIAASAAAALQSSQTAIAQAGLATAQAQAASSVAQQDLSGATLAALHRSTNTVVQAIVYDTSRDYDGGAWREKCAHLSWMNEPLNGNWLANPDPAGWQSELHARASGATLGAEALGAWSTVTANTTVNSGTLTIGSYPASGLQIVSQNTLSANTLYLVTYTIVSIVGSLSCGSSTSGVIRNVPGTYTEVLPAGSTYFGLQARASGLTSAVITGISVKPITAFNTKSGDYYPDATTGKFYRLWKNLIDATDDFTKWGSSGVTVTADQAMAPSGQLTADLLTYGAANFSFVNRAPSTTMTANAPVTGSIVLKPGTLAGGFVQIGDSTSTNTVFVRYAVAGGVITLGSSGVGGAGVYVGSTIAPDPVSGGYLVTVTGRFTSAVAVGMLLSNNTNGAGTIYASQAQVEYGTAFTSYDGSRPSGAAGLSTAQDETFRGNTAKFPRMAAIVAEAASLTIYALDQPGRPMAFRFVAAANNMLSGTITSVGVLNGDIVIGTNTGLFRVSMPHDAAFLYSTSPDKTYKGNVAQRGGANGYV